MTSERDPGRRGPVDPEPAKASTDLVGTWIRQERDQTPYPDELTFEADGIYSGRKAPGSPIASKLDVGVFDRMAGGSIRMSTATDTLETFALHVSAGELKLVDEDGKSHSYKRRTDAANASSTGSGDAGSRAPTEKRAHQPAGEEWKP